MLEVYGKKPTQLLALISSLEIRIIYDGLNADAKVDNRRARLLEDTQEFEDDDDIEPEGQIELDKLIVSYTEGFIDVQLLIERPELIGRSGQPDTLSITFWDTKFFMNKAE